MAHVYHDGGKHGSKQETHHQSPRNEGNLDVSIYKISRQSRHVAGHIGAIISSTQKTKGIYGPGNSRQRTSSWRSCKNVRPLFSRSIPALPPFYTGSLHLSNRFICSSMGRCHFFTEKLCRYVLSVFREKASVPLLHHTNRSATYLAPEPEITLVKTSV